MTFVDTFTNEEDYKGVEPVFLDETEDEEQVVIEVYEKITEEKGKLVYEYPEKLRFKK